MLFLLQFGYARVGFDLVLECRQVINYGRKSPVLHVQLAVKLAILLKEELRYVC